MIKEGCFLLGQHYHMSFKKLEGALNLQENIPLNLEQLRQDFCPNFHSGIKPEN
jgi:hypothetical protein